MKAIILLQEFRKIKVGNDFVGYQELKEEVQSKINEAIEELEELENRSCSNCKHSLNLHNTKNIINSELVCKIDSRYNNKDFCCNKWGNKQ